MEMLDLHEDEINIYKNELVRENKTPKEIERILDRINRAMKNARMSRKSIGKENLKFVTRVGDIALIVAGSTVGVRYDKK